MRFFSHSFTSFTKVLLLNAAIISFTSASVYASGKGEDYFGGLKKGFLAKKKRNTSSSRRTQARQETSPTLPRQPSLVAQAPQSLWDHPSGKDWQGCISPLSSLVNAPWNFISIGKSSEFVSYYGLSPDEYKSLSSIDLAFILRNNFDDFLAKGVQHPCGLYAGHYLFNFTLAQDLPIDFPTLMNAGHHLVKTLLEARATPHLTISNLVELSPESNQHSGALTIRPVSKAESRPSWFSQRQPNYGYFALPVGGETRYVVYDRSLLKHFQQDGQMFSWGKAMVPCFPWRSFQYEATSETALTSKGQCGFLLQADGSLVPPHNDTYIISDFSWDFMSSLPSAATQSSYLYCSEPGSNLPYFVALESEKDELSDSTKLLLSLQQNARHYNRDGIIRLLPRSSTSRAPYSRTEAMFFLATAEALLASDGLPDQHPKRQMIEVAKKRMELLMLEDAYYRDVQVEADAILKPHVEKKMVQEDVKIEFQQLKTAERSKFQKAAEGEGDVSGAPSKRRGGWKKKASKLRARFKKKVLAEKISPEVKEKAKLQAQEIVLRKIHEEVRETIKTSRNFSRGQVESLLDDVIHRITHEETLPLQRGKKVAPRGGSSHSATMLNNTDTGSTAAVALARRSQRKGYQVGTVRKILATTFENILNTLQNPSPAKKKKKQGRGKKK